MLSLASDNPIPGANRRGLLRKVHVAAKVLSMAEDDYRELLQRVTGERSAADCSNSQLEAVVTEFRRLGFVSAGAAPARAKAASPVATKARAMWISLHQLGAIDDPSEAALESFGARQLGVERLQWADERQGFRLIEALKAIAERHGWKQQLSSRLSRTARVRLLKERLLIALMAKLGTFDAAPIGPVAQNPASWSPRELDKVIRTLADRLSEARRSAG